MNPTLLLAPLAVASWNASTSSSIPNIRPSALGCALQNCPFSALKMIQFLVRMLPINWPRGRGSKPAGAWNSVPVSKYDNLWDRPVSGGCFERSGSRVATGLCPQAAGPDTTHSGLVEFPVRVTLGSSFLATQGWRPEPLRGSKAAPQRCSQGGARASLAPGYCLRLVGAWSARAKNPAEIRL
jgi:hypothetical protein